MDNPDIRHDIRIAGGGPNGELTRDDYLYLEEVALMNICEQLFSKKAHEAAMRKMRHAHLQHDPLPIIELVKWLLWGKMSAQQRRDVHLLVAKHLDATCPLKAQHDGGTPVHRVWPI